MSKIGDNRLAALAGSIRDACQAIADSSTTIAERAIEAGRALIEAKSLVKHGQWQGWLRDNCGMSERSAQRYMQLARSGMKTATVADLGIRGASAAIARHAPRETSNPGEQAACDAWFAEVAGLLERAPSAVRHEMLSAMRAHVDVERGLPAGFLASLECDGSGKVIVAVRAAA